MALHLDINNFQQEVLNSFEPVLVDFYADWCGPCKMIAPIIEEISQSDVGVKVCKLNVDNAFPIANKYKVVSIPSIFIFKNGKVIAKTFGYQSKEELLKFIEGALNGSNS